MKYLFDTNIFITSKNQLPADIWPTFWERMAELIRDGRIYSSIKVKEEIERGEDELTAWMKEHSVEGFYIPLDGDIMQQHRIGQTAVRTLSPRLSILMLMWQMPISLLPHQPRIWYW